MNISNMLKVFEYSILRENGVNVTYDQFGLKSDPYAALTQNSSFNSILSSLGVSSYGTSTASLTMPTAPTPPADSTNTEAQKAYQQELLAYTQKLQSYNQNMMRLMMQQFMLMQQRMQSQMSSARTNSTSSSSESSTIGTGGILDV